MGNEVVASNNLCYKHSADFFLKIEFFGLSPFLDLDLNNCSETNSFSAYIIKIHYFNLLQILHKKS